MALTLHYLISKLEILDFGSDCSTPSIGRDDLKMKSFFRHACSHLWPSLAFFSVLGCQMALTLHYSISKLDILDFGSECSTPSIGRDDLKMKSFFRHAFDHFWPSLAFFPVATMPNGFDFTLFNFQMRYFRFWIRE